MKRSDVISKAISLALLACLAPLAANAVECRNTAFEQLSFTICEIDPAQETVRLFLNGDDGRPLASFAGIERTLKSEDLVFAMNAGMFHPDRSPVGLYVENGETQRRIVTRAGPGNFGLLPNGVLCLTDSAAAVIESRRFAEDAPACRFATQSGPMLVIDGALHPRFIPGGSSLNIRNGIGVRADGTLVAAISNEPVNFDTFARLFRDDLKTPNALFLDGRVSRLFAPSLGRNDFGLPLGPMIGVVKPRD